MEPKSRSEARARAILTLALLAMLGCERAPERSFVARRFVDLEVVDGEGIGRFEGAVARSRGEAQARDLSVHGDRRSGVSLEAPGRIVFRSDSVTSPQLRFGLAVRPPNARVELSVSANGEAIHEEVWIEERDWVERRIPLSMQSGHSGEPLEIEMSFEGDDATVLLAHPEILGVARDPRPNVIVYVVDCLRADHVGAYGYPRETTPEIDRLAEDGVLLEDLNSCASWTKPSTACLFTSMLPSFHQARTVDDALPRSRLTLAETFRRASYTTAAFVANPVIDARVFLFHQGFDRWVDLRSFEERSRQSNLHDMNPDAADITRNVIPWLEQHKSDRFFLYLHSLDLHFPYLARTPFDATLVSETSVGLDRDRELYDSELAYNDREIGKLVESLKELGLYDETLLFVTADHGEEFGEHGATRHGTTLYQQVLHIPGVLKLPGSRLRGRRSEALVSNIDVAPTLLEIAGVPAPEEFQGRSFLDILENGAARTNRRAVAELLAPNVVGYSIRDERFKHIKGLVPELSEMLFDLEKDSDETVNLLPSVPGEAASLIADLDRLVQLGQHGTHVSLRGESSGAVMRVFVRSSSEIVSAFRFAISTGDVLEVAPDRRSLELRFRVDGKTRHLVVETNPPGAELSLRVTENEEPLPIGAYRVGLDGRLPEGGSFSPPALAVSTEAAERLLHEPGGLVRAWYLAPDSGRHQVELDDETLSILRTLGYIP
jgi:arylsulfatase A-like enzyme